MSTVEVRNHKCKRVKWMNLGGAPLLRVERLLFNDGDVMAAVEIRGFCNKGHKVMARLMTIYCPMCGVLLDRIKP